MTKTLERLTLFILSIIQLKNAGEMRGLLINNHLPAISICCSGKFVLKTNCMVRIGYDHERKVINENLNNSNT